MRHVVRDGDVRLDVGRAEDFRYDLDDATRVDAATAWVFGAPEDATDAETRQQQSAQTTKSTEFKRYTNFKTALNHGLTAETGASAYSPVINRQQDVCEV